MNDIDLVLMAQSGDADAFARLVDRYRDPVCAFVRQRVRDRAAADDVAQETFVVAYRDLARLERPEQVAGWLLGIARNLSARALRDAGRARTGSLDEAEAQAALAGGRGPLPPESEAVEERDLAAAVSRAVGALDDSYRAALTLRFREGRSYREIATAMGCRIGTVSSLIHRGLALLAPRLAPLGRAVVGEADTEAALRALAERGRGPTS